jgi:hypothetical protein
MDYPHANNGVNTTSYASFAGPYVGELTRGLNVIDVADCLGAGMTLQGRVAALLRRSTGSGTGTAAIAVAAVTSDNGAFGADTVIDASSVTAISDGWKSGSWADVLSGSAIGARLLLHGKTNDGGGTTTYLVDHARIYLRFKK